ncbi:uncharacterized protein [Lepeophtheirus salmonis]|uniref:uncharacterized protein n=1 Tax=Lepeophtheirus salmonis TaxID=72036 RepID=UPI001AE3EDD5|nr:DNA polymerase epsilon subunit 4-like [Lepeophtheirus salmonis]
MLSESEDVLFQETEQIVPQEPILSSETQFILPTEQEEEEAIDLLHGETEELIEEDSNFMDSETVSQSILQEQPEVHCLSDTEELEKEDKLYRLPLGRIKNIMKCDPELNLASADSVFLVTKATELFIQNLAEECYLYTKSSKKKTITKKDFDKALDNATPLAFLEGTLEE